jgi:hypothetical protein
MTEHILSAREIEKKDIELIIQYWLGASSKFLEGMGVDITKMPGNSEWSKMLTEQIDLPLAEKKSYCIIWLVDDIPVGHSNINKIMLG